jgi:hypothetical protein
VRIEPAADLGVRLETLFGEATLDLPNPLVYANFSAQCDAATRRSLLSRNMPQRIHVPPVSLVRYPPGILVNGDRSYLAVAGEAIVREQVAPWNADPAQEVLQMQAAQPADIQLPCLLLARFGERTWGHFVSEILVKAAMAERFFPGRFFYAVPWWTTEPTAERSYATVVLEALAAYGIGPERLLRMGAFQVFRFSALHDITGYWNDGLHPGALACLRVPRTIRKRGDPKRKIALLRRPPDARAVFNAGAVHKRLAALGFSPIDPTSRHFLDQIRLFDEAEIVVGSLGSNFAAALCAGQERRLISLAPAAWEDGYFIRMFQRLGTLHGDFRGPSTLLDGDDGERSPHLVDPERLAEAVEAVAGAAPGEAGLMVDGEWVPRRIGALLLDFDFADGGNAEAIVAGEWSAPEDTHRWSLGASSGCAFSRETLPRGASFWLEIAGQGHVYPPHLPTRPFSVLVNDVEAGSFEVIGRTRLFCRLTPEMLGAADMVSLTFHHPICPSPRAMGAGADDRPLGFGFETMRVFAAASG